MHLFSVKKYIFSKKYFLKFNKNVQFKFKVSFTNKILI